MVSGSIPGHSVVGACGASFGHAMQILEHGGDGEGARAVLAEIAAEIELKKKTSIGERGDQNRKSVSDLLREVETARWNRV